MNGPHSDRGFKIARRRDKAGLWEGSESAPKMPVRRAILNVFHLIVRLAFSMKIRWTYRSILRTHHSLAAGAPKD
jgi:hypothetical protein